LCSTSTTGSIGCSAMVRLARTERKRRRHHQGVEPPLLDLAHRAIDRALLLARPDDRQVVADEVGLRLDPAVSWWK